MQQPGAKHEMGGTDFKRGADIPFPPLATPCRALTNCSDNCQQLTLPKPFRLVVCEECVRGMTTPQIISGLLQLTSD